MNLRNRKHLFNLFGGSIIVLWLVLLGLLVKRVSFDNSGNQAGSTKEKVAGSLSSQCEWMEIYIKDKKVGYSMRRVQPTGELYYIQEGILLNLNLMGQPTDVQSITKSVVDQQFLLKNFDFSIRSGAFAFVASGRVEANLMHLEIGEGASKRTERIRLTNRPMIGSALAQLFKGRELYLGQSFKFPVFDPSTLAQEEVVVKVMAKESVCIRRIEYKAFRLETEMWGQDLTFWVDESGNVLKEQGFMGLTLIKSSAAMARRNLEGSGGNDFYELSAVKVKGKLQEPDKVTYLKLKLEGVNEGQLDMDVLNKGRQIFQSGILEIVREQAPLYSSYTLPYEDPSGEMKPFLQSDYGIESDNEIVIKKSREIAKGARESAVVARRLMTWVYRNVDKKPVVAVPSALEVLKTGVGDCNEHSVLLTALLRSAGIPARICVGLVYARRRFYYHAWTEAYLGKWVSMDSTLNQMPTDATHIKMIEGGLQKQVDIIGLIGKINLEIVDCRYD